MATYTPTQFYEAQPGTSDTLLYTVPGATSVIVLTLTVTNTTGTAATITLGLDSGGALAAANHFLSVKSVPANDVLVYHLRKVLLTGETIRALQGTASALTVMLDGVAFA